MLVRSYISHTRNKYNGLKDGFQTDEVPRIYFVHSTRLITENPYVMITDRQDLGMQERR